MSLFSVRSGWEQRALACAVLALLCPSALAQVPRNPQEPKNLALNGSFENPSVGKAQRLLSAGAWSAQRGTIELLNDGAITSTQTGTLGLVYDSGGPAAADGHQYLALNSLAIVGQTCATKPGQDYALSFAYSARRGGPEVRFEVWYGGGLKDTVVVPGKSAEGWIQKSYSVVGASSRDRLEFRCLSANSIGILIDACALVPFDPSSSAELLRNGDFEDDPRIPPGTSLETPVYVGWSSGRHYDIRIENMGSA